MQTSERTGLIQQELVNGITHGFGIILGIMSIPILIAFAIKSNNTPRVGGAAIYGFYFLELFIFSTLYQGFQHVQAKRVFEILDHISIYFLIAGTYTPFLLICLDNSFGLTLLVILWGLTALGIIFKNFFYRAMEYIVNSYLHIHGMYNDSRRALLAILVTV